MNSTNRCSFSSINRDMPADMLSELQVTKLKKKDAFELEKRAAISEWKEKAAAAKLQNDVDWDGRGDVAAKQRMKTVLGVSYWSKLKVDVFFDEVQSVLPFLWKDEMRNDTKKSMLEKLRAELVKAIAAEEQPNTLAPDHDLSGMDADRIHLFFVKIGDSQHYEAAETEYQQKLQLNRDILKSCGGTIPNRARYLVDMDALFDVAEEEEKDNDIDFL